MMMVIKCFCGAEIISEKDLVVSMEELFIRNGKTLCFECSGCGNKIEIFMEVYQYGNLVKGLG
jgi:hypothetical protein